MRRHRGLDQALEASDPGIEFFELIEQLVPHALSPFRLGMNGANPRAPPRRPGDKALRATNASAQQRALQALADPADPADPAAVVNDRFAGSN